MYNEGMLNKSKELNNMKKKFVANAKNSHGKPKAYRYFYDNRWEFYSCGGMEFGMQIIRFRQNIFVATVITSR